MAVWVDLIGVLLVLVLVTANGFFVAAEFSLVAVRRSRVTQLVVAGRRDGSFLIDGMMSAQDAFDVLAIPRPTEDSTRLRGSCSPDSGICP